MELTLQTSRFTKWYGFTVLMFVTACGFGAGSSINSSDTVSIPADPHWIVKASRVLRMDKEPSPREMRSLQGRSEDEVIAYFFKDPLFIDTVLDFNLYFLGLKGSSTSGQSRSLKKFPQVITGALAIKEEGDYFDMFNWRQPKYFSYSPLFLSPELKQLSPDLDKTYSQFTNPLEGRRALGREYSKKLLNLSEVFATGDMENACREVESVKEIFGYYPLNINIDLEEGINLDDEVSICEGEDRNAVEPSHIATTLRKKVRRVDTILNFFESVGPKDIPYDTNASKASTFIRLDHPLPGLIEDDEFVAFSSSLWSELSNSSTNFNRKRAAYILKTYFCDDLTPIDIVQSSAVNQIAHTENKHASDPACQSCHFRLDPMAGYFRYHGAIGFNFEDPLLNRERDYPVSEQDQDYFAARFFFDDLTTLNQEQYDEYLNSWRATNGNSWHVGYLGEQKVGFDGPEGTELVDLFKFIRSSKVARQCLTERLATYILGENQVYDRGWLHEVGASMDSAPTSAIGFKDAVAALVKSQTFKQLDPVKGECYDFAEDYKPEGTPPCEVAFVLEKNCVKCHKAGNEEGDLNLESWVATKNGQYSFRHLDADERIYSKEESLQEILRRITTTNRRERMPKKMGLAAADFEILKAWLDSELSKLGGARDQ